MTSPLGIPAAALTALGIGILAYRAYLTLSGEFGLRVWEVSLLSSVRLVASSESSLAGGLGIVEVFDFDRARSLLRQRMDAQAGMLLVALGTLLSLWGLVVREEIPIRGEAVAAFAGGVGGIAFAWIITKTFRAGWRRIRERWWLARTWLTWLERQIADPLAQTVNVSQDLVYITLASPHPELEAFLQGRTAGRKYEPLTLDDRQAIEEWIADLAASCRHRFGSKGWREWESRTKRQKPKPGREL